MEHIINIGVHLSLIIASHILNGAIPKNKRGLKVLTAAISKNKQDVKFLMQQYLRDKGIILQQYLRDHIKVSTAVISKNKRDHKFLLGFWEISIDKRDLVFHLQ